MLQPLIFLLIVYIYVAYRSKQPDKATVKEVMKKLQNNQIDVKQLAVW
jgi:hypothetical protein